MTRSVHQSAAFWLLVSFSLLAGCSSDGTTDGGLGGAPGAGGSTGGATSGTGGGTASGGQTGTGGTATGGSATGGGGNSECTPDPEGLQVNESEGVVLDEATCLRWTKSYEPNLKYFPAEAYCDGLTLGGYDDWRLPTAGEVVGLFKCDNTYPVLKPNFTASPSGIWTTTETETIAGDERKVCGAGEDSGQFYDFGKDGEKSTRCVRGAITLPDRTDCIKNTQICPKAG